VSRYTEIRCSGLFIGNQQNKNLVIKVCDAGNAVDLSRHVIYASKSSIKLHSSQNCRKGTAYLSVSFVIWQIFAYSEIGTDFFKII